MQRIAVPMIGGTVSSAVLTLVVIPADHGLVMASGPPDTATLPASNDQGRMPLAEE